MKMTGDVLSYLTVFNIGSSLCRRGACGFCLFPKVIRWVTKRLVVDSEKPAFKDYKWEDTGQKLLFRTRELSVVFDKADAAFTFQETSTGKLLLKEKGDRKARNFKRSVAGGEQCLEVTQRFVPTEDEAIYGLGQYQNGIMNYRGKSVLLLQANMDIVNPFLFRPTDTVSYGIIILLRSLKIRRRATHLLPK